MKTTEIRELTVDELKRQIQEKRKSLFEARFKLSMHQLENTAQLRTIKHEIAQFYTILHEKTKQA